METETIKVEKSGPGGCPVLHGLNLVGDEAVNRPGAYTALARREAPVFFVPETGFFVATRHADVERVLTDHEYFEPILPPAVVPEEARDLLPDGFVYQRSGALTAESPPSHTRIRKLAQKGFTRGAVESWREPTERICQGLVDEFADKGEAELIDAYTRRFPILVMAAVLQIDAGEAPQLYDWALDIFRLFGDPAIPHEELFAICRRQAEFENWALGLITERRRAPRGEGDIVSSLITAVDNEGTSRLSDEEIFSVIVAMIAGGADTSSASAAQMTRRILSDPDLQRRVLAEPGFLSVLMEEDLRHDFVGRIAFRQVSPKGAELSGVSLPPGAIIGAHIWSANHDEEAFSDPDHFDPDRGDVKNLLSWGKKTHFCLGAPLARLEVPIAVRTLFERLPNLELVSGHEIERMPAFFLPNVVGGLFVTWDRG